MSNTLVNRDLGLRDYELVRTERMKSEIRYHLHDPKPSCPLCDSKNVAREGFTPRTIRITGVEEKRCYAVVNVPRVRCRDCHAVSRGKVRFADPNKSYSRSFERTVLRHIRLASSLQDVAEHVGYDWHIVKDIHKRELKRKFGKTPLRHLKHIAIDEVYLGRKLKYRTLVLDLDSSAIVYVGQGRDSEALQPFWRSLRGSGARVKAVAMDMSRAYAAAVTRNLPKARIVFDPFHVVKLMNEHLDEIRRQLVREAEKKPRGKPSRASDGCSSRAGKASATRGRAGTAAASGNNWNRPLK
jgi:transposase